MKNLKKTLSFVLVLAMVLGMVSTAFAFTDDATITNKEAVAVLSAIDVISGYSDGSFNATKTVTRGQAAAFICRMLLGRKQADKLVAIEAPFSDVPETNQFAGYIAYCVAQGIVDGYSDGTFKPLADVTAIQFGKMILTALGYNSAYEGFTGTGWKTNVYNNLVSANLLSSITFSANAGCTREQAAQICFNALTVNRRTFSAGKGGSTVITVGDAKVEIGGVQGSYTSTTVTPILEAVYGDEDVNGALWPAGNYDDPLNPTTNKWVLAKGETVTTVYEVPVAASYTSKDQYVLQTALYKALGLTTTAGVTVDSYLNGKKLVKEIDDKAVVITNYAAASGSGYAYYFGYGTSSEVYKTGTNKYSIITFAKTAVQATAAYNATKKGVEIAGEFVYTSEFAVADSATKKGDWFIVTYNGNDIASVEDAVVVEGAFSAYVAKSSITVGGTKYSYAYEAKYDTNGKLGGQYNIDDVADDLANGEKIALVLDAAGYAYTVTEPAEEEAAAATYLYLTTVGNAKTSVYSEDLTYYGKGYLADGTTFADYVLADDYEVNTWYQYTVKNNVYTLVPATIAEEDGEVVDYAPSISIGSLKASTSTKYIVKYYNAAGTLKTDLIVGYKNTPSFTGTVYFDTLAVKAGSKIAAIVIMDATEAELVTPPTVVESKDTFVVSWGDDVTSYGSTNGTPWTTLSYCYTYAGDATKLTFETAALDGLKQYYYEAKETTYYYGTMITNVVYDSLGFICGYEVVDGDEVLTNVNAFEFKCGTKTLKSYVTYYINVIDKSTVVLNYWNGSKITEGECLEMADDCVVYVYASGVKAVCTVDTLVDTVKDSYLGGNYVASAWYETNAAGEVTKLIIWGSYSATK